MTRCLACRSPRVAGLDAALASGKSIAFASRLAGLPYDSVKRHRRSGHVPGLGGAVAAGPPPLPGSASPEEQVRAIVASLGAVDVTRLSQTAQLALFAERRRAAESLSRIAGPAPADGLAEELADVKAAYLVLVGVLDRHPLVRREASDAMRAEHPGWFTTVTQKEEG